MNWYPFIRNALFKLDPEVAHHATLQLLKFAAALRLFPARQFHHTQQVMGIAFPNRVGLAAGLDKNGEYISALARLGFGFIEIGTVTPRAQSGNPKPRLFRLSQDEALINRLGFNNQGMDYVAQQIERAEYQGVLGINIGKNRDTPIEQAADDYLACFRRLAPLATYITINISSPNTAQLRDLQQNEPLTKLLGQLKEAQAKLSRRVPLVVKISPDLSEEEIDSVAEVCLQQQIDGIIATNTTIARDGLSGNNHASETGGLSGKPLFARSTNVLSKLSQQLQSQIPLIGVGGVMDAASAQEKIAAGASLVQIYTGFIYRGPGLIAEVGKL